MIHKMKWINSRVFEKSEMSFAEVIQLCQETGKAVICGVEVTIHPETKEISYDVDAFTEIHGEYERPQGSAWRDTSNDHVYAYQEKVRYME